VKTIEPYHTDFISQVDFLNLMERSKQATCVILKILRHQIRLPAVYIGFSAALAASWSSSLQPEAPGNRIHLVSEARELFASYCKVEDVEGTVIQPKKVDAAVHVSPLANEFVRKHCAFELTAVFL
jgi:hypothetical protein